MEEVIFAYPLAAHGSSRKRGGRDVAGHIARRYIAPDFTRRKPNAEAHRLYIDSSLQAEVDGVPSIEKNR